MAPRLRPYQRDLDTDSDEAWRNGAVDVGLNSPTGSGKTVTMAHKIRKHNGASIAVAHRQELVSQLSVALGRNEVRHKIIAPKKIVTNINSIHLAEFGKTYLDPNSRAAVAGVRKLKSLPDDDPAFAQTTLTSWDEAHHVLRDNEWGIARKRFVNPTHRALHVSATWQRADGAGLGRHADGFVDILLNAPTMRAMIDDGYLTDYTVYSIKTEDLNLQNVHIASNGELNLKELCEATKASQLLVGDIVKHYIQRAMGRLGVTFCVDVEEAVRQAAAFRSQGVPAEVITSKTPDHLRMAILRRFKRREVLQLVNVDLFGEGFDLPAIECVSMGRATESWALYCQQWGRALRLMVDDSLYPFWDDLSAEQRRGHIAASGKPRGIIFDHVGNLFRHMGPPDKRTQFSLNRYERRGSNAPTDAVPYRVCLNPNANDTGIPCNQPYERVLVCCPHCKFYPVPAARSSPDFVDGDLFELSEDTLAQMRGEIALVNGSWVPVPEGVDERARRGIENRHWEKQQMQASLRIAMQWWRGLQDALGRPSDEESFRRFYLTFGIDTATAQTLPPADAEKLRDKICYVLLRHGIDGTVNPGLV